MKKNEIIKQLNELIDYAKDYVVMSKHSTTCECDDIWSKDIDALTNSILAINMLHSIFENLDGQDILGEMISILNKMGYSPLDFDTLGICSSEQAIQYIENYNDTI